MFNVRVGSNPEVSDGHENVGFWGQSGLRFRAAGLPILATSGHITRMPDTSAKRRLCCKTIFGDRERRLPTSINSVC